MFRSTPLRWNQVYDDFILSNNAAHQDLIDSFESAVGVPLESRPLKFRTVETIGRVMDLLIRWLLRSADFPLSEATARLMFANMAYSPEKARGALGFRPRSVQDTFFDHFEDLIHRKLIASERQPGEPSIW